MKCPICAVDLMMTERHGIEIDYCPKCRGVWLDRGELDKLIEKSAEDASHVSKEYLATRKSEDKFKNDKYDQQREHERSHHYDDDYYRKKHKKKGLLRDLFDF